MSLQEENLDLDTMIKRLAIFASVPNRENKNEAEVEEEEDEEEEEEDEFDEDYDINDEYKISNSDNKQNGHCYDNGILFNSFGDANDRHFEEEEEEQHLQLFDQNEQNYDKRIENDNTNYFTQCGLSNLTIKTDYSCSVNNQLSPRHQLYEMADELENLKKKYENALVELNSYKIKQKINEEKLQETIKENETLRSDLFYSNLLVKDLRSKSYSENFVNQLETIKAENKSLNDQIFALQTTNTQLENQVQKLKKYENYCKSINLIAINQKIYQQIDKIGKGGFSEVYSCVLTQESKCYALKKVNLAELDSEGTNLVLNEIELLKKLQSTNKVIELIDYEYQQQKKTLNLVLELGSCDLSHVFKKEIKKYNCVKEPSRVYYWQKMLEAVKAIHDLGIIHSDLKPGNFLVVGEEIKLIDFNISNSLNDRTSITVQNDMGTIEYMCPDAFQKDNSSSNKINKKVDVWSLGVILYLITYGRLPLQHLKNYYQKMHAICDPLQKEFVFNSIENTLLLDVFKKCFSYNSNERSSVDELLLHPYIQSRT